MSDRDRKLQEIAQKFQRDMERIGLGVSISTDDGPMVEIVAPPCRCGHVHINGRTGSCSKFTCVCKTYREAK